MSAISLFLSYANEKEGGMQGKKEGGGRGEGKGRTGRMRVG